MGMARNIAKEFLRECLHTQERPAVSVDAEAAAAGISRRTLLRAKKE